MSIWKKIGIGIGGLIVASVSLVHASGVYPPADVNQDGNVSVIDIGMVVAEFGAVYPKQVTNTPVASTPVDTETPTATPTATAEPTATLTVTPTPTLTVFKSIPLPEGAVTSDEGYCYSDVCEAYDVGVRGPGPALDDLLAFYDDALPIGEGFGAWEWCWGLSLTDYVSRVYQRGGDQPGSSLKVYIGFDWFFTDNIRIEFNEVRAYVQCDSTPPLSGPATLGVRR